MKIKLEEAKENLPVSFLTSFVSDGWDKVGLLKDNIEAIKREFKGTKKIEDLIQALIDAYLVCIGQIEQHLADKDYLDIPEVEEVKESLQEDVNINIEKVVINEPEVSDVEIEHENEPEEIPAVNVPTEDIAIEEPVEDKTLADKVSEIEAACNGDDCEDNQEVDQDEKFEYFVDEFPEPVKDAEIDEEK